MSNLDQYSRNPNPQPGRALSPLVALGIAMGGVLAMVGWLVLGFAMIFVWVFGSQSEALELRKFSGAIRTAEGRVQTVTATDFSEGGGKSSPGTPILQVDFEYELSDGRTLTDKCYTLGSQFAPGQDVRVEYVTGPPPRARIAGTRLAPFTSAVMFVVVFPLIGVVLIVIAYVLGFRTLAVILRGKLAMGRLVDKQVTNVQVNKRYVFKFTFAFTDEKGATHRATVKTHKTELLEDQAEERLFYDPNKPGNARMVDLLPRGLKVGDDGSIYAGSAVFLMISAFVVPAVVIAVHVMVGWMVLR